MYKVLIKSCMSEKSLLRAHDLSTFNVWPPASDILSNKSLPDQIYFLISRLGSYFIYSYIFMK